MIERTARPIPRRVLIIDDEIASPVFPAGRSVRALAEKLRTRDMEVVQALSSEDGLATLVSDSAIHWVFLKWREKCKWRGPIGERERYASRVFGARRSHSGLSGSSGPTGR